MTKQAVPYSEALPIAEHIVQTIAPYCLRIEIAGSLRRRKETIGDIEIVAIPRRPKNLFGQELLQESTQLDSFMDSKGVAFTKRGTLYQQFPYRGLTVDLFLPMISTWGCVYTIRTGNADFSRWLVSAKAIGGALQQSLRFWQGRLFESSRVLETPEEADVFAAIGIEYIEPHNRNGWPQAWTEIEPIWNYSTVPHIQVAETN